MKTESNKNEFVYSVDNTASSNLNMMVNDFIYYYRKDLGLTNLNSSWCFSGHHFQTGLGFYTRASQNFLFRGYDINKEIFQR